MRKGIARKLRDEFSLQLKERFPAFALAKGLRLPSDLRVYQWKQPGLACFLVLNLHPYEDAFTVEVSWSTTGDWADASTVSPGTVPEVVDRQGVLFRIVLFWSKDQDHWWYLGPSLREFHANDTGDFLSAPTRLEEYSPEAAAIARVDSQVSDAMEKIGQHAVPYFRRIAAQIESGG